MTVLSCRALLFDLDGTLINSIPAVDRCWRAFALRHELDPDYVFTRIHGRRSIDSIRELLPHVNAEAEDAVLRKCESTDTEGVTAFPGAVAFLESLPADRWGIVTSGTSDVAQARMAAAGIPAPRIAVYGEDVANGKPAPDPYLLGAQRLGIKPSACIGFEDTVAGMNSILAAGMTAIAVNLVDYAPWIPHYEGIQFAIEAGELKLTLPNG